MAAEPRLRGGFALKLRLCVASVLAAAVIGGCEAEPEVKKPKLVDVRLTSDEVRTHVDRELDFAFYQRRLNTTDHAAWQIIHGVLPYEKDTLIDADGKTVRAIEYALAGGTMKGWALERGDLLDKETMRYGVRSQLELGSKSGQGHPDQWLGYLQDCGVTLEDKVLIDGKTYTVNDWVEQIERDIHRNPNQEYSWTLMALTKYRPTTHTWKATDGSEWSIAKLLESEIDAGVEGAACGGSHRMVGITHAFNRHKASGHKIEGVWQRAEKLIEDCKEGCRQYQNPDGSLSSNFFRRPGQAAEVADRLHATGHQLEFLIVAMDDQEIKQDWVRRAVLDLTESLRKTHPVALECGALYHGLRGLALYRERTWGKKTYPVDKM
jgi:hypothetical protein